MSCYPTATCHIAGAPTWHVIPVPHVTFHSAATLRIQCNVISEPRCATCYIAGCCHMANSMSCHQRAMCYIAGCCHLGNSVSCHPRDTRYIAGCFYLANSMSCHQTYVSHCSVLPLSLLCPVIRQPRVTLQGAPKWRI